MAISAATQQLIALAKDSLTRRESLDGAGQAIVKAFGIDPKIARQLQLEEVRRRRLATENKENGNG